MGVMGRPKLGEKKRMRMAIRVQQRFIDKLDRMAEIKGVTRGKLAADILERAIMRGRLSRPEQSGM
jgi:predicted DNA-binding ribbon-helix-helix protein